MIKNIIGLMKPDTGQILYDGRDLITMNKHELNMLRREMGMLFQGSALFDSMTVLENVMFPLDMFSKDSTKERRKRAEFCLERVNLSGVWLHNPMIFLIITVLPEPLRQMIRFVLPSSNVVLISFKTARPSKDFVRFLTSIIFK